MAKLKAYDYRTRVDTVESNEELGFAAGLRAYELPAEVLKLLGVASVRLITNNPPGCRAGSQPALRFVERSRRGREPRRASRVRAHQQDKDGALQDSLAGEERVG